MSRIAKGSLKTRYAKLALARIAKGDGLFWLSTEMNDPDQDTVLRAVEDARRILGEYIAPGPRDATQTVERLLTVLDRDELLHALDRMQRCRTFRLVGVTPRQGSALF
jgi:hypothetical protein